MSRQPIRCGDSVVGWIERIGGDNYWTVASFERGCDYERFKVLIEATLNEADDDVIALDRVNELNLTVGDPPSPIRDFQMTSPSAVEFKDGTWA